MRVVVLGATGNVGTSLVEALGRDDEVAEVVGVARRMPAWDPPKVRWVAADLATDELTPLLAGADAVVHLAWLFQPTHRPEITWRNNVLGTRRLLESLAEAAVPALVYASSVGAYSPPDNPDVSVDESWPTEALPTAAYGREKSYVERLLDVFELEHPACRVVRMRPAFIFKRTSSAAQRRLFLGPLALPGLLRPDWLPVLPWNRRFRFQALHSADAAEAYRLALHAEVRGAFNLAADPVVNGAVLSELLDTRVVEVPDAIFRAAVAAAWHARLVPASPQLVDLVRTLPLLRVGRAHEELRWMPRRSSAEALRAFLEGVRDDAGLDTPVLQPDEPGDKVAQLAGGVAER